MQNIWVEWTTVQTDVQSIEKATFSFFFFIFPQKKNDIDRFLLEEASFFDWLK